MFDVKTFELEKRVQSLERSVFGVGMLAIAGLSVAMIAIYLLLSQ